MSSEKSVPPLGRVRSVIVASETVFVIRPTSVRTYERSELDVETIRSQLPDDVVEFSDGSV